MAAGAGIRFRLSPDIFREICLNGRTHSRMIFFDGLIVGVAVEILIENSSFLVKPLNGVDGSFQLQFPIPFGLLWSPGKVSFRGE